MTLAADAGVVSPVCAAEMVSGVPHLPGVGLTLDARLLCGVSLPVDRQPASQPASQPAGRRDQTGPCYCLRMVVTKLRLLFGAAAANYRRLAAVQTRWSADGLAYCKISVSARLLCAPLFPPFSQ